MPTPMNPSAQEGAGLPRVRRWHLLLLAVVIEVGSTLALKGAIEVPALYPVVVCGYVLGFVLLTMILKLGVPIAIVYGISSALGVAATATMSAIVFGEPMNVRLVTGIALVVVGVLVIEFGSRGASGPAAR